LIPGFAGYASRWILLEEASMLKKTVLLALVVVFLLAGLLSIPGCISNNEEGEDLPPLLEEPDKGNPNLDGHLNDLIRAEERGEAELFASRSGDIELVDGSVMVIIECLPGQVEVAAESVAAYGIVELTTRRGLIQALVPITSLTALAEAEGIRRVRLPVYAEDN